ncbi:unnamed protein product [Protopolystoma xenopodis]|uniref:C2 domain-containing protein n=1 Tax=Protopolystoma xenopodis TaxID=117903 RepID=A0A448WYN3_9PLAT|nr:unnamed protein product [Protopolystoma xenopodis]
MTLFDPSRYVKSYLLPDKTKISKRRSSRKKGSLNPVFSEEFKYKISQSELASRSLQLSIWHYQAIGPNLFLGEVTLSLENYNFDPALKWYSLQERVSLLFLLHTI